MLDVAMSQAAVNTSEQLAKQVQVQAHPCVTLD